VRVCVQKQQQKQQQSVGQEEEKISGFD